MSTRSSELQRRASDLTSPQAAQVRTSRDRAQSIKQYIEGLLPSDLAAEVDVVVTEEVSTAAVLPTTADALLDGDETDFDRQQAKQLVERVEGDYLVLVTGQEADTDTICLSDQLTADTAHQFGLAFHETLHILKTSFGAVQTLVENEVDEQYQDFLHELINIGEDGAIENEAQTGDDFTERAGNRLTLVREIHSQTIEDLPDTQHEFSFGDALLKALHDEIIYPTGVTEALLDESDSRVGFRNADERKAFTEIHEEIETLRDDILSMRSDHSDRLYEDDREASLQRAKRILVFWHDVLKPVIENSEPPEQQTQRSQQQQGQPQDTDQGSEQNQPPQGSDPETDQPDPSDETSGTDERDQIDAGEPANEDSNLDCPDCEDSFDSEHGRRVHYGQQHGDTDELDTQLENSNQAEAGGAENSNTDANVNEGLSDGEFDPDELSLDADNYENALQSVDDHPSVTDEPDPSDVDPESASETSETPVDSRQNSDDSTNGNDNSESNTPTASSEAENQDTDNELGGESTELANTGDNCEENSSTESTAHSASSESSPEAGSADSDPDNGGDEQTSDSDIADGGKSEPGSPKPASDTEQSTKTTTSSSTSSSGLASHAESSGTNDGNEQATFGDFADGSSSSEAGKRETPNEEHGNNQTDRDAAEADSSHNLGEGTEDTTKPDTASPSGPDEGQQQDNESGVNFDPSEAASNQDTPTPSGTSKNSDEAEASTLDEADTSSTRSDEASNTQADSNGIEAESDGRPDSVSDGPEGRHDSNEKEPSTPAHAETDLEPEDFAGDRQRANRTANESTIDERGLEDDLRSLESALGAEAEAAPDNGDTSGTGAGPGSVGELTILPDPENGESTEDWQAIEESADTVADTLANELRLDQQTDTRNGLSAGTRVNTKTAYRLGHNDPRTFSETLPGDEKEYFVVIVLDRSGSMSPGFRSSTGKIDIATSAVTRFAVACEDLDIDVAIIDFYDDEARYVKPPSVDAEFAQGSILNTDTEGGTPLSDALSLARTVADTSSRESLIISMTDDKPDDTESVKTQIKSAYSPICSLTIATDCTPGNPPSQAASLEKAYDQTTTVFDAEQLDSRLDELAALLGAY